jgi:hypothetical protein
VTDALRQVIADLGAPTQYDDATGDEYDRLLAGIGRRADEATFAPALVDGLARFRRWMHMPDPGALLVVLATVAANRSAGDPVWTLIVGPPGGGKTEVIGSITGLPDVHPAATITEAALLSGTPKKERDASAKGGLLRQIDKFGILVCKDFGSVLSMHREARAAVLAALREVYDGAWTRHLGTGGGTTLHWEGKVGLVAGCTPSIDSHHAVMGAMGERFITYRLPPVDADAQAGRALEHVGRENEMRQELAAAAASILDATNSVQLGAAPTSDERERLIRIATLAVRCRSAVERDSYSREIELIPEAEAPGRMALVLLRLRNALLAIGLDDATAWRLIAKCALDSMPAIRRSVLELLVSATSPSSTSDIGRCIGYPTTTTRRALEDLAGHGIVNRTSTGQGQADIWTASPWATDRWSATVPEVSGAA